MTTLRISGYEPGFRKVQHSLYLHDVLGLRLAESKSVTDDVLLGIARAVLVPESEAEVHLAALRRLGARVESEVSAGVVGCMAGTASVIGDLLAPFDEPWEAGR